MEIKWPKVKGSDLFRRTVAKHAKLILEGRLLVVDQASGRESMPGYALYVAGQMIEKGVIDVTSKDTTRDRLEQILECFRSSFDPVDVLAIEDLKGGRVNNTTHWSTAMAVVGVRYKVRIPVRIEFWKAVAKATPDYFKADDNDAAIMGKTLVLLAEGAR